MKDIHTSHCRILHGCKYGEDDVCTVVQKIAPQQLICEMCFYEGIETIEALHEVIEKSNRKS